MRTELRARGLELARVLAAENAALEAGAPAEAAALLPAKAAAITAFEAATRETGSAAGSVAGTELRDIVGHLTRLGSENRRLLVRALAVQGRVIALIARAMPPANQPGYGQPPRHCRPSPIAISASA